MKAEIAEQSPRKRQRGKKCSDGLRREERISSFKVFRRGQGRTREEEEEEE